MGRIKREGSDVTKRTQQPSIQRASQTITAVLDEPDAILVTDVPQSFRIEGIAKWMRQDNRLGLALHDELFDKAHIRCKGIQIHIDENRYKSILNDRVECGWKPCRRGNDLIAYVGFASSELRSGDRCDGEEVGRGARIDESHVSNQSSEEEP